MRTLLVGERVSVVDLPSAIDEQADGCALTSMAVPVAELQALEVEHPLALHLESLPRGRQHLDPWRLLDHLGEQITRVEQVLEVVEHKQRRALAQVINKLIASRKRAMRAVDLELQALSDRGREQVGSRDTNERNEVHAVLITVDPASRRLERQSRLTDAARPHQRQQAAVGLVEHALDRRQLVGSPHEGGARGWKVAQSSLERPQRWKLRRQTVDLELEDALRRAQVFQPVRAEVAYVRVHERSGRLRQEHLSSVADRGNARSLVDVEAHVPLLGHARLTCVQPHSHTDRAARQCQLRISGRSDPIRRAAERDEKGVALGVHFDALVSSERLPEQSPMLLQRIGIGVSEFVQKLRRPFDVREEKGDDAGRKRGGHAAMILGGDPRVYSSATTLLITEVLHDVRRLCSSQTHGVPRCWGQILGTG